jgi:SAM-dependent methyltransferase
LTTVGVFVERSPGEFENTPLSDALRGDHPQSMKSYAIFLSAPFIWKAWGDLYEAVRSGDTAFQHAHGKPYFAFLAENPGDAAVFNAAMNSGSAMSGPAVTAAYDFSRFTKIVDVGGGQGLLLHAILTAAPQTRGVLFDFPEVVAGAALLRSGDVAGRCEIVGGDFFESIPDGGDVYILKGVIHDWNDREAVKILNSCRRAVASGGKLLLYETVLDPRQESVSANFMDVLMMALTGGRERTEDDFRELLRGAGFSLTRAIPTSSPAFLIEAELA